ncbi:hypothetical protein NLM16_05485 [Bradyrhizobium brasilense]|uniref:hypothetical protein n=1 Tax=Bradyrhizobium brasilense TaxID=1419277 RepID=UPI002877347B|nr:hypothetical protein [Bradyrhizobium brasilense]MCP3413549.1 hypothetical protein [Bradyrhizobium brasilense]
MIFSFRFDAAVSWAPRPSLDCSVSRIIRLKITRGDELTLAYPQNDALPESFVHLAFDNLLVRLTDGLDLA